MLKRKRIIANWKMNGSKQLCYDITEASIKSITNTFPNFDILSQLELVICPPTVYLDFFYQFLNKISLELFNDINKSPLSLGAQNFSCYEKGAYTGEIGSYMLKEIGCQYVIIGHSERREFFNENEKDIAIKIFQALKHSITPIICIGEPLESYNNNSTFTYLDKQLESIKKSLEYYVKEFGNEYMGAIIIAYEPLWAIGTGIIPDISVVKQIARFITSVIPKAEVIYGGSVNFSNIAQFLKIPEIEGVLVGNASLNCDNWGKIIHEAISIF